MNTQTIFDEIKAAIEQAPRNMQTVEKHTQMLKYADKLANISGKEFCEKVNLEPSWGTEFNKMRNLAPRLKAAGLDINRL